MASLLAPKAAATAAIDRTDDVLKWFDAIWRGGATLTATQQTTTTTTSSSTARSMALEALASLSIALHNVFFPPLPPWLATWCSACRAIAAIIVAPLLLVAIIDFAEYLVFRTFGLNRRIVRVKRRQPSFRQRMQLPPRQDGAAPPLVSPGPLLTRGAYDAEALLRHRARSVSSASQEALEEWQRTGGSFARVAEVRQASATPSGASTPMPQGVPGFNFDSVPHSPSIARASIGVDGALGLSESEAEGDDSGAESGSSSPVMGYRSSSSGGRQRQGLKGSKFNFTPVERKPSLRKQHHHQNGRPKSASVSSDDDTDGQLTTGSWIGIDPGQLSAAAAAADLERDVAAPMA